jgi:hypothetical protein
LNPKLLAKILRVFTSPTAKNRHQPPRSVSAGHIRVDVDADSLSVGRGSDNISPVLAGRRLPTWQSPFALASHLPGASTSPREDVRLCPVGGNALRGGPRSVWRVQGAHVLSSQCAETLACQAARAVSHHRGLVGHWPSGTLGEDERRRSRPTTSERKWKAHSPPFFSEIGWLERH